MIENISRYLERGESPAAPPAWFSRSASPSSADVSLVAVLIPLLFMREVVGACSEFAVTLAVTILISAVVPHPGADAVRTLAQASPSEPGHKRHHEENWLPVIACTASA